MKWVPLAAAVVGLVGCVVGAIAAPRDTAFAWVVGQRLALGVGLGAMTWLAVTELAPIRWMAALRPTGRALSWLTVAAAVGWIPVLFAVRELYPWVVSPNRPHSATDRSAWLSVRAFDARTIAVLLFFAVLAATARAEKRAAWSLAMVLAGGPAWCLFAFDAWMSLDPDWKSSIYAMIAFSSGLRNGLAALILLGAWEDRASPAPLPPDVWHALGRLLLTTILFWAYLQFSQFFIVWIGGEPNEITYYLERSHGGALAASVALVVLATALVIALLSRALKRSRTLVSWAAVATLALGALEAAWDVLPHARGPIQWPVLVASALAWIGGGAALAGFVRGRLGDDEARSTSLAYRSR